MGSQTPGPRIIRDESESLRPERYAQMGIARTMRIEALSDLQHRTCSCSKALILAFTSSHLRAPSPADEAPVWLVSHKIIRREIDGHEVVKQSRTVNQLKQRSHRHQIIGLDKPSAVAGELAIQASIHERHRLESVAEEVVLACVLAGSKVIGSADLVTVQGGARYQFGRGVREDNTVAAHCLPGRLLINARPIDTLSQWVSEDSLKHRGIKSLPMTSKLRNLHGRTDVVDVMVNRADSRLERMTLGRGLKPLFGRTVHQVVAPCALEGNVNVPMILEVGHAAMDLYRLSGQLMCEELYDTLSIELRKIGSEAESKFITSSMVVLESYFSELNDTSFIPDSLSVPGCELTVNEVSGIGE